MNYVRAPQIRAARAMLGWSQDDLAQSAGLSINTIRQIELGAIAPRGATTNIIRKTIEEAGIEFLNSEGIRRRLDDLKIYQDFDSCDLFFQDVMQTASSNNGEVLAVAQSQRMLEQTLGIGGRHNLERVAQLKAIAHVKCLIWENSATSVVMPCQFRVLPKQQIGPTGYFIYGGKHAVVHSKNRGHPLFVVFEYLDVAQTYRDHFLALWDVAPPLSS